MTNSGSEMPLVRAAALAAALAVAGPLAAHHSYAMFDLDREIELDGVVKEFQWTNPHIWVQLMVTGADGRQTEWSLESGSVNMMARQGWHSRMLQPGEHVRVVGNPLLSGEPAARLVRIVRDDGTVIDNASSQR